MNRIKWVVLASLCILTWIPPSSQTDCGFRIPYDEDESDKSQKHSRIVGGRNALTGEWPWTVSLQTENGHFCTGSILSALWVLSAAHCYNIKVRYSFVQAGVTILKKREGSIHGVKKVIIHADFGKNGMDSDIALLLLETPINISKLTTPICLPPRETFKMDDWKSCHMAGWGLLFEGSKRSTSILQSVDVKLIEWTKCKHTVHALTKNMLCAGFEQGGKDACQGDSGAPLMCQKPQGKTWYQLGIVSWGSGCGRKKSPGVYLLLPNYLPWIQKVATEEQSPLEQDSQRMSPEVEEETTEENFDTEKQENNTEEQQKNDKENSKLAEVEGKAAREEKHSTEEPTMESTEKSFVPEEAEEATKTSATMMNQTRITLRSQIGRPTAVPAH